MAGGQGGSGPRSGTPWGELERIDEERKRHADERTRRILEAMLEASGEKGYRRVAVQDVLDRYGGNRVQFYRLFSGKAECYEMAYEAEISRLGDRVMATARAVDGWSRGVRAALEDLAGFAVERPLLARGLVVEVHVAGGRALHRRAEALARFERALDLGREECAPRHPAPSLTASFLTGSVESALFATLAAGEPEAFAAAIPGLTHVIVATYLGEGEASREDAAADVA